MPSIEWNKHQWDVLHGWEESGSEWSRAWGGDDMQWYGCIFPRIHRYLPTEHILELAPGYGRWTKYLAQYCKRLTAVDISSKCIAKCNERYSSIEHLEFHVNDGQTLPMVSNNSVTFVFSFDSLVHVEADVIASYLNEIHRVIKNNGVAFLHHSNLGKYSKYFYLIKAIKRMIARSEVEAGRVNTKSGTPIEITTANPSLAQNILAYLRPLLGIDSDHSRAISMSADLLSRLADQSGLRCISQENINWGSKRMIDCISVVTRKHSTWPSTSATDNPHFMQEAEFIKALSKNYGQCGIKAE